MRAWQLSTFIPRTYGADASIGIFYFSLSVACLQVLVVICGSVGGETNDDYGHDGSI